MLNNYFAKSKRPFGFPVGEIYVQKAEEVPDDFHARKNVLNKIYLYRIGFPSSPLAFKKDYIFYVKQKLKISKMRKAAKYLIGEHDFSAFKNASKNTPSPIKTIYKIKIKKSSSDKNILEIFVKGNAFLYKMVRIIVGTLIEIGIGKRAPEEMKEILESKNRDKAGPAAPACGLYLYEVNYKKQKH